jgi:hypothetical protein
MCGSIESLCMDFVDFSQRRSHRFYSSLILVKVSVLCPGLVRINIANAERNKPAELRMENPKALGQRW